MTDDKTKTASHDRMRVAGGEEYEVRQLVEKNGVTDSEARVLIRRHGNDSKMIEEALKKLKGAG